MSGTRVRFASPTTDVCPVRGLRVRQAIPGPESGVLNARQSAMRQQILPGKFCRAAGIALRNEMGMIKA